MRRPVSIAPPKGKLGVLTPGNGSREHHADGRRRSWSAAASMPVGSLTQMGTIRLGKRTEARIPKIKDFVKLAELDDMVFGGWDVFPDNAYQAATKAGVLDASDLAKGREIPEDDSSPMKAAFDQNYVKNLQRHERQEGQDEIRSRRADSRRHPRLQKEKQARPPRDGVVRLHGSVS